MKLKRNILILFGVWTLIIGFSLSISYFQARDAAHNSATAAARSLFTKDVLYRHWNAHHGGVYVPITESTQPNPYLTQIQDRDVETLSGKRLTLINPAYMTRQVHELGLESKGIGGDITSLNPIRPSNTPDPWQKKALKEFEQGASEYASVKNLQGKEHLRFMRPLMTEKACLTCHAQQGYELGDVRGGISITLPMGPYVSSMWKQMTFLGSVYGVIWFLGLTGLGLGYMFNRRGIIERRKAEEELQKLRRSVQNSPAAIVITDTQGNIEYSNPAFTKITGYSPEETLGQNPRILKSGFHENSFYQDLWGTISSGEVWRGEIYNRRKDGEYYWEQVSISPVKNENNSITNYVGVKEDISHKKELQQLKESVDRIIRHDLKTSLNGIIGLPQVLKMDENLTDEQIELLENIEESGRKMLNEIDMSLDLFKIETGKYEYYPEQVNAVSIVFQVVEQFRSKWSAKKLSIQIYLNGNLLSGDEVFSIWSSQQFLESLLSNLFDNAVEASPQGEKIVIELCDSEPIVISISNTGAVPLAARENFFEKYSTYGKNQGTGLGTYTAKLFANAMHCEISMQTSDEENSTCLKISIPRQDK
jgi:PAS domain S-box-containing protein